MYLSKTKKGITSGHYGKEMLIFFFSIESSCKNKSSSTSPLPNPLPKCIEPRHKKSGRNNITSFVLICQIETDHHMWEWKKKYKNLESVCEKRIERKNPKTKKTREMLSVSEQNRFRTETCFYRLISTDGHLPLFMTSIARGRFDILLDPVVSRPRSCSMRARKIVSTFWKRKISLQL